MRASISNAQIVDKRFTEKAAVSNLMLLIHRLVCCDSELRGWFFTHGSDEVAGGKRHDWGGQMGWDGITPEVLSGFVPAVASAQALGFEVHKGTQGAADVVARRLRGAALGCFHTR